jgi:hypothetical protein
MRRIVLTLAVALSASAFAIKAEAMPLGNAIGDAADTLNVVEQSQFIYGGRNYCWYPDGWRGPGWYWCGYHLRRGFGWGGPVGWRGWRHGGPAVVVGPRGGVAVVGPRGGRVIHGPRVGGPRMGGQGRRRH